MLTQQLTTWAVHLLILNKDLHHQALIYYENLLKMIDGLIQTQAEQDRDSQKQLQTLCPPIAWQNNLYKTTVGLS